MGGEIAPVSASLSAPLLTAIVSNFIEGILARDRAVSGLRENKKDQRKDVKAQGRKERPVPFLLVYRSCALQFLEPVEHEVELGWLPHVPMAHHEKTLAVAVDVIVRAVPSG